MKFRIVKSIELDHNNVRKDVFRIQKSKKVLFFGEFWYQGLKFDSIEKAEERISLYFLRQEIEKEKVKVVKEYASKE